MKERLAIIDGVRTPFSKAGMLLKNIQADDLGAIAVKELMVRSPLGYEEIDEVIIGNVAQPAHAANIGRVVALKAGFPNTTSAFTVHRNCASGMEAISTAANKIFAGEAQIILAGGTESMSNIPFLFSPKMKAYFETLMRLKTPLQKIKHLSQFKLSYLKPTIGLVQGLTDPVCGLIMGLTAENLAKEFHVTREDQDEYALNSHQKTILAQEKQIFKDEIVPLPLPPKYKEVLETDEGPRANQSLEALGKLKPYFDRKNGTVTVGNSCPVNDGAAAVLVMSESEAKKRKLKPLGFIRDYAYAGLEPERMGLGPTYATSKVFDKSGLSLKDIDLIEMNEAFASQIIANIKAFESDEFAKKYLGKEKALGKIDLNKFNVNGGAIAIGHPVGATGTRLIITLLKELHRQKAKRGLATLCIGGGQGGSFIVEAE